MKYSNTYDIIHAYTQKNMKSLPSCRFENTENYPITTIKCMYSSDSYSIDNEFNVINEYKANLETKEFL